MRVPFRTRIQIIYIFVSLFVVIALVRLFYVQIIHGDTYRQMADRQYAAPTGHIFDRGTIYFEQKDGTLISAATLKTTYYITLNPTLIEDAPETYTKLSAVTPIDKDTFLAKATKKNDVYELIVRGLSSDVANAVAALKLPGVGVYKEATRLYPANTLAAQVLGYVGLSKDSGSTPIGQYGIEKKYDSILSRSGSDVNINFFAELFGNLKAVTAGNLNPQGDIVLTIEPTVQGFLEKQLAAVKEKWSADAAGGIIIQPKTGKIVAMAGLPTFDPNQFSSAPSVAVFKNPLVQNVYEMGSILKPLTMAAGIDAGVVTPETHYNDTGFVIIDGKKISNFDGKARGDIPMQEILNQSLNVGSVYVEQKLGAEVFSNYFRNFGLGTTTAIDLPGEVTGLVKNLDSTVAVDVATAAFGQGIAVTPIEITRALATLANGGVLMRPYVVDKIIYPAGVETDTTPLMQGRVIKEETAKTLSTMLTTVVDKYLANGTVKMANYSVAAKTGTAQMPDPQTGKYFGNRYLHSFFGYFPAQEPQYLTFLYIVYPKNVEYASGTLTEPFQNITKFLIQYYNVPPDR
jgi:cell division protein FtsI/penicillin-binding protein 2